MKLSDYVISRIAREVRHIFLLPGGGCMHLIESVGQCEGLTYICHLHEQACAIAADAYAQYANSLGVALVTTGPGGSNALTGVAGSWIDSTPCLILSGQVKRADLMAGRGVRQMGFQELDIRRMAESVTKYAVTVTAPETIRYHLERALHVARTGRPGPVWLDIPLDVQASDIDPSALKGYEAEDAGGEGPSADQAMREAAAETVRLLNAAERPAILVGHGVRQAGALELFQQVIEMLRIPVLTTWRAIDFLPEDHPLYVGRPGAVGQRAANFAQQTADLLLILGARLDLGQTGYNHAHFAPAARKIMVDIDPAEIGKMGMTLDMPVCADAKRFLEALLALRETVVPRERPAWWARCREWKRRYPVVLPEYWEETDGINTYALIDALSDALSGDDLVIPGSSGTCAEITMQAFRVKPGMRIFNNPGLGAMGFGLPAAIGGCLAGGGRRTICIDGDGGFQMNVQELETVRRLNLPIKFFILNNNGYASIQATQRTHFQGHLVACGPSSGLTLPSLEKLAAAYDIRFFSLGRTGDLRRRVQEILASPGPVLCDVAVTPGQCTAPRIASAQAADGTMVSRPLEDLWPFLSRDEFEANMRQEEA